MPKPLNNIDITNFVRPGPHHCLSWTSEQYLSHPQDQIGFLLYRAARNMMQVRHSQIMLAYGIQPLSSTWWIILGWAPPNLYSDFPPPFVSIQGLASCVLVVLEIWSRYSDVRVGGDGGREDSSQKPCHHNNICSTCWTSYLMESIRMLLHVAQVEFGTELERQCNPTPPIA